MAHDTAILDFGSSKITVLIGERGVNDTISIKGMGECNYAGFGKGEWYAPESLAHVVGRAISIAETNAGIKITKLYVGVPGEFSSVVVKDVSTTFNKRRRVNDNDVFELMNAGDDFDSALNEVINIQPIYYTLDNDRRLLQPVGMQSTKLGGTLSYILAETKFTKLVRAIFAGFDIQDIEFVSSVLAESIMLFDEEQRDATAVLIDIGYITSTVAVVRGDGLLSMASFSMGGGHIAGDLAMALKISFTEAETLKRKVVLSINAGDDDIYEITGKDGVKTLPAKLVNEIVAHRVQVIGKAIAKCLSIAEYEYPDYIPYSLTGGGICFIRGAKDILSQQLNRNIEIATSSLPQNNRPNQSSAWGLLDLAIANDEPVKKGFFAKLADIFKK